MAEFTDTHTHLYDEAFDEDIDSVIGQSIAYGVKKMILPNVDSSTAGRMRSLAGRYPGHCFMLMGVHPTSLDGNNTESELSAVRENLALGGYAGVGEIGMDLYWDKTHLNEQQYAFDAQLGMAGQYGLPVSVHCREAFGQTLEILEGHAGRGLKGVFHCFSGDAAMARRVLESGMLLGVGGTVTYKNNPLKDVVKEVGVENIVLETDSPYLAPVPYRGKRNVSSYITNIAAFVASYCGVTMEYLSQATEENVRKTFGI